MTKSTSVRPNNKVSSIALKIDRRIQSTKGIFYYNFTQRRRLVCLVSSMRAGSTLLKALMGQAEDVSHLSEYDFSKLNRSGKYIGQVKLREIADEPIILLKRPRWFTDTDYPKVPSFASNVIVLYRDVVGVVASSMKRWPDRNAEELIDYWVFTYQEIAKRLENYPKDRTLHVRYEDLTESPKVVTGHLFKSIGSVQQQGISSYSLPEKGQWKWGKDDGSEKIKQLEVKASKGLNENMVHISSLVEKRNDVQCLRDHYREMSDRKHF